MQAPIIGITVDNRDNTRASGTYEVAVAYGQAVSRAGGVPILLPHELERVGEYLQLCRGLILTGGVDPDTRSFGKPIHPRARRMDPTRQAFELALLDAARGGDKQGDRHAVLGVCLGMQLMALHGGGTLNQFLPDTLEHPEIHAKNSRHRVEVVALNSALFDGCGDGGCDANHDQSAYGVKETPDLGATGGLFASEIAASNGTGGQTTSGARDSRARFIDDGYESETVVSSHQQAVADAGRLRIAARAADGVIEAIDDPMRAFYGGVQWHPERGGEGPLNAGLIGRLVHAARRRTSS